MKVYSRGNNGEILMHSDTYLGEDYTSPNLMHYKYLRKYQKNGHTYYVYDDSEYKRNKKIAEYANNYRDNTTFIDSKGRVNQKYNGGGSIGNALAAWEKGGRDIAYINGKQKQTSKDKAKEFLYNQATKTVKKHRKQTLKDIPKRIFSRAVSAVSSILRWMRGD